LVLSSFQAPDDAEVVNPKINYWQRGEALPKTLLELQAFPRFLPAFERVSSPASPTRSAEGLWLEGLEDLAAVGERAEQLETRIGKPAYAKCLGRLPDVTSLTVDLPFLNSVLSREAENGNTSRAERRP
jgi:hypothetical protein